EDERIARTAAEREAGELRVQLQDIRSEVESLQSADQKKAADIESLRAELTAVETRRRRNRGLVVAIVGLLLVIWDDPVAGTINTHVSGVASYWAYLVGAVRAIGMLMIALPCAVLISGARWIEEYRIAALTILFAIVYILLPGITDGWKTIFSDPL